MEGLTLIAPLAGVISLFFAAFLANSVLKEDTGNKKMQAVACEIQEEAMAYLSRQYRTIAAASIMLAFLILFFLDNGMKIAIGFLAEAISSALAALLG